MSERFLLKKTDSKELTELTHEEWDKVLQSESPNAYNKLHGGSNDCEVQTN